MTRWRWHTMTLTHDEPAMTMRHDTMRYDTMKCSTRWDTMIAFLPMADRRCDTIRWNGGSWRDGTRRWQAGWWRGDTIRWRDAFAHWRDDTIRWCHGRSRGDTMQWNLDWFLHDDDDTRNRDDDGVWRWVLSSAGPCNISIYNQGSWARALRNHVSPMGEPLPKTIKIIAFDTFWIKTGVINGFGKSFGSGLHVPDIQKHQNPDLLMILGDPCP